MLGGAISWKIFENKLNDLSKEVKDSLGEGVKLFLLSDKGTYVYHWDDSKALKYARNDDGSLKLNDIKEPIISSTNIQDEKLLQKASKAVLSREKTNIEVTEDSVDYQYFFYSGKRHTLFSGY